MGVVKQDACSSGRVQGAHWLAAVFALLAITQVQAQGFPTKTLRIVVPFPAGGPVDVTGRTLGNKLAEFSGQTVLVENRAGGGTIIGTEIVAKSAPDGHTLLIGPTQITVNPALYPKLPYNTLTDLVPVTQISSSPFLLVAHSNFAPRTLQEMVALAKSKPGALHCSSSGIGSGTHLACELFNYATGVKLAHVPYKGAVPAMNDILGGQVEMGFTNLIGRDRKSTRLNSSH